MLVWFGANLTGEGSSLNHWFVRDSGITSDLNAVAYGNGCFVAVGDGGTIVTSTNGIGWTSQAAGTASSLLDITWAGGVFIAVGASNTVLTSSDGKIWTSRSVSGDSITLRCVTHGNGGFAAVGFGPASQDNVSSYLTNYSFISVDGQTWTSAVVFTSTRLPHSLITGITHANGLFVATAGDGYDCQPAILTSGDGRAWTPVRYASYASVASGRGLFVALSSEATSCGGQIGKTPIVVTSIDGETWVRTEFAFGGAKVTYGSGFFMAVGGSAWGIGEDGCHYTDGVAIASSEDGFRWTDRLVGFRRKLRGTTYGGGFFVAVGVCGTVLQSAPIIRVEASPNSSTTLNISGPVGQYRIEIADQLARTNTWRAVTTISVTNSSQSWIDMQTTNANTRFYRAVLLP